MPFGNTQEGPDRPRSARITDPLSRGFGIPNRSPVPLVQRAGRDHPRSEGGGGGGGVGNEYHTLTLCLEREREREKFIDNQIDDSRSVSTTPLPGDTTPGHSWPSIWRRVLYPPLSVWPCGTRFSNTQEGPDRPRSAPITDPLSRGFGIPTDPPTPWYNGRAGIILRKREVLLTIKK